MRIVSFGETGLTKVVAVESRQVVATWGTQARGMGATAATFVDAALVGADLLAPVEVDAARAAASTATAGEGTVARRQQSDQALHAPPDAGTFATSGTGEQE